MQPLVLLLGLTALLAAPLLCAAVGFVRTGDCEDGLENRYEYKAEQSHFENDNMETIKITCTVITTCEAVGTYGDKQSRLYHMVVSDTKASGNIFDKKSDDNSVNTNTDIDNEDALEEETTVKTFDDIMAQWFKFVQTEDGSIPAVFHPNSEDASSINFKKAITAAFQANFKGTSSKVEADPQSVHVAEYTYEASAQDEAAGKVKMHRSITSKNVEDYSSHVPGDEVAVDREEDIEYTKGVMTHSAGVSTVKMMPQDEVSDEDTDIVEGDSLGGDLGSDRKKRDLDMSDYFEFLSKSVPESQQEEDDSSDTEIGYAADDEHDGDDNDSNDDNDNNASAMEEDPTYDSNTDLPDFDAKGTYSLDLTGQRRLLRQERSAAVNHLELPEAMESTLMAHIDHTREDMYHMTTLRSELGDIHHALDAIHKDPNATLSLVNKIEDLVTLEATYGPLSGLTPVIDTVLDYLHQLTGSEGEHDSEMGALLYFMLSREGSFRAQQALLAALDSATDEEEQRTVVVYIAFTENPQPQMVSELEDRIGDDTHSTDALLLAYGALVAEASPDLQQRMTLFLLSRLPHAEANSSSLIHHILSLGNTESHQVVSVLTDYLEHPDHHVQLSSIYALRYATGDSLVQKALITLLSRSFISDEHLATTLQCLLYGVEHASNSHTEKPFNSDLAHVLSSSVMQSDSAELQMAFINYLQLINSRESINILKLMKAPQNDGYSNSTRIRRGSNWAEKKSVYNLVASLATRQKDVKLYGKRKSYIWGKKFGVKKGNVQIAAGGFIGVSKAGDYKVYGRARAVGHAFGKTKTALDFLVHREKNKKYTITRLYGEIIGKTLININVKSKSVVCKTYSKPLYNPKKYKLFSFKFSIFIYVGSLKFNLAGYVKLNSDLFVKFCEKRGRLTAEAGLVTTITMKLQAGATANLLLVARGGISVSAVFNYQLTPKLSTEVCFTKYKIRVKNCVGIYHQWANNRIILNVWYQLRKVKWCKKWGVPYPCGISWGSKKKWKALSTSWKLKSSKRKALWKKCDKKFVCKAVAGPVYRKGPTSFCG